MNGSGRFGARCFGLDWCSDLALDQFDPADVPADGSAIVVRLVTSLPDRRLRMLSPRMELAADGFRFCWNDEAVFDGCAGTGVSVMPASAWTGRLPAAFFSTVTATLLAWRGLVPMHMSSVVHGGRAWLIAGAGGAGKSTLTAELIAAGAEFLSDDLSVLRAGEGQLLVTRGRPAIRLYPPAAELIESTETRPVPDDTRGKLLATPRRRAPDQSYPIGGIIALVAPDRVVAAAENTRQILAGSLFRPRIMTRTPAGAQIMQHVADLAAAHRVLAIPALAFPDPAQRKARLARVLALMQGDGTHR